eukprot:7401739-Pyramimonas_sp.AAC.1
MFCALAAECPRPQQRVSRSSVPNASTLHAAARCPGEYLAESLAGEYRALESLAGEHLAADLADRAGEYLAGLAA